MAASYGMMASGEVKCVVDLTLGPDENHDAGAATRHSVAYPHEHIDVLNDATQ